MTEALGGECFVSSSCQHDSAKVSMNAPKIVIRVPELVGAKTHIGCSSVAENLPNKFKT